MSRVHWTDRTEQLPDPLHPDCTAKAIRSAVDTLNYWLETAAKQGLTVDLSQFCVAHMGRTKYSQLNVEVMKVEHL